MSSTLDQQEYFNIVSLNYSRFHRRSSQPNVTLPHSRMLANVGLAWPASTFRYRSSLIQVDELLWRQSRFTGYVKLVLCKAADCLQLAELRDLIWVRLIKDMNPQPPDCFCSFKLHRASSGKIKTASGTFIPTLPAVAGIQTHTP